MTNQNPSFSAELRDLIKDLDKFCDDIVSINYNREPKLFYKKMEALWDYVKAFDNEKLFESFRNTAEFIELQAKFKTLEEYYERALEIDDAMVVLGKASKDYTVDSMKNSFAIDNYNVVSEELKYFEKKNIEHLVMVGCGPLPETILFIAENTNIKKIIGIDCSQEAIAVAGKVVNAVGHDQRVQLIYAYGEEYDYKDADAVYLANSIHGKNLVLKRIFDTAGSSVEVLLRAPVLLANLLFTDVEDNHSNFFIKKRGDKVSSFLDVPVLMKR